MGFIVFFRLLLIVSLLAITGNIFSQKKENKPIRNQVIRGYIIDRTTGNGLASAHVKLLNYHPIISTISGKDGYFELKEVPVGHQRLHISLKNYYEAVHPQLVVVGKQAVVNIPLEEQVSMKMVTVEDNREGGKAGVYKNTKLETVDQMNTVSAHPINMEEVGHYISGFNDPARSIGNLPGLFNMDDTQNDIISRGNSSHGIQFLVEGVPIENPHHFAIMGFTSGSLPLINTNVLDNSDFVNGALSAKYGNVYSGVFDAKLRKGNNQRHEFMGQINILGVELSAEGPIKKGKSSYLVNVRGSIFSLLHFLGIDTRVNSIPQYADINFKFHFPTKRAGTFSFFGIGGSSSAELLGTGTRDLNDLFSIKGINAYVQTNSELLGLNHLYYFNNKSSLNTVVSYVNQYYYDKRDTILPNNNIVSHSGGDRAYQKVGLSSIFKKKLSSRMLLRVGLQGYLFFFKTNYYNKITNSFEFLSNKMELQANSFVELQYKFSRKWKMTIGLQTMFWSLSKKNWSIDPRVALNWEPHSKHKFSLGYGLHSRTFNLLYAFYVTPSNYGTYNYSNRVVDALHSHHTVLSYSWLFARYWAVKANVYFQYQTNVPVEKVPSSFSMLNMGPYETIILRNNLENTGLGYSYGTEVSLDKFFGKGYYGLLTGSYQRSFYRGSDKIWRNSAFDTRYVASLLTGKEFKIGAQKRNVFYVDARFRVHGGLPYIPVDLEASKQAGYQVLDFDRAFEERVKSYKRLDLRVGFRFNHRKKRISHHIYLEVLNPLQLENEASKRYDPEEQAVVHTTQYGFFPNLLYQIRF